MSEQVAPEQQQLYDGACPRCGLPIVENCEPDGDEYGVHYWHFFECTGPEHHHYPAERNPGMREYIPVWEEET